MRVQNRPENKIQKSGTKEQSRRSFVKSIGFFVSLYFIPLSACKRISSNNENRPDAYTLSQAEKNILSSVQSHLLPTEGQGPGAIEINALNYYEFVLQDKHLHITDRKLLINGIRWVEDTALEMYNKSFDLLGTEEKEAVLRDLETYTNGENWLSKVVTYLFEALLGSPAYGINTDQKGWKWLRHTPGYPQPAKNYIYGTYGYGI